MTRDEVLDVLESIQPLKRKKLARHDVPVQFLENRIAVILPAERYREDEMRKIDGKFQFLMSTQRRAHAYLDFARDWRGLESTLSGGFF